METGAYLEAFKLKQKVTHTLCLARDSNQEAFKILSPCGVCQERLISWGPDVLCAVTTPENTLTFVPLGELQPYHWFNAYE